MKIGGNNYFIQPKDEKINAISSNKLGVNQSQPSQKKALPKSRPIPIPKSARQSTHHNTSHNDFIFQKKLYDARTWAMYNLITAHRKMHNIGNTDTQSNAQPPQVHESKASDAKATDNTPAHDQDQDHPMMFQLDP
jgi:hypothetical protein